MQYQHLEHQHNVLPLGASIALARHVMHPRQVGTEGFPVNQHIEFNQWATQLAELGDTDLKVKESRLEVRLHSLRLGIFSLPHHLIPSPQCFQVHAKKSDL